RQERGAVTEAPRRGGEAVPLTPPQTRQLQQLPRSRRQPNEGAGAVWGEGETDDRLRAFPGSRQRPAGLDVPQADRLVGAAGQEALAVRRESRRHDDVLVPLDGPPHGPIRGADEQAVAVPATREQQPTVRADGQATDALGHERNVQG